MDDYQGHSQNLSSISGDKFVEEQEIFPRLAQHRRQAQDLFTTLLRENQDVMNEFQMEEEVFISSQEIFDRKSVSEKQRLNEKLQIQNVNKIQPKIEKRDENGTERKKRKKVRKKYRLPGKTKEDSAWMEDSEDSSYFQNQSSAYKKKPKTKKISTEKNTKNLLINFKLLFVKYIKKYITEEDEFLSEFEKNKSINKSDYQRLFREKRYEGVLERLFEERFLQRQILLSRVDGKLKIVYLKKIQVLKKGFIKKRFPRIN